MPSIDLFSFVLNAQLISSVSWQPDPSAKFIDAPPVNCRQFKLFYEFPPFSMVTNCRQKMDLNTKTVVLLLGPTQRQWFTHALQMMVINDVPND